MRKGLSPYMYQLHFRTCCHDKALTIRHRVICRLDLWSQAHQLKVFPGDRLLLQEAINDIDGEKEGVWQKLELLVDLHEPVDQNSPHLGIDISLLHIQKQRGQSKPQLPLLKASSHAQHLLHASCSARVVFLTFLAM